MTSQVPNDTKANLLQHRHINKSHWSISTSSEQKNARTLKKSLIKDVIKKMKSSAGTFSIMSQQQIDVVREVDIKNKKNLH